MSKQYSFNIGDSVVYPTHGVGKILSEEIDNYGGVEIKVYVITFENNNMFVGLPPGAYDFVVQDAAGCEYVEEVVVPTPILPALLINSLLEMVAAPPVVPEGKVLIPTEPFSLKVMMDPNPLSTYFQPPSL